MKRAWAVAFGLLAALFLSTCGGGGGGDTLSYTGLTTPASIDNTNAEAIARAAYEGGEWSDTSFLPELLAAGGEETVGSGPLRVIPLVHTFLKLAGAIGGQNLAAPTGLASPQVVYRDSWREYGVSGHVDISAAWDDQTGGLWGSFSFSGYDDGSGIVLNGQVGFSGTTSIYYTPQPMPGDLLDLALSLSFFTSTDGIETVRMRGTIDFLFNVPTGGPVVATVNLVTRDEVTEKTVWIKDYTVVVFLGDDSTFGAYSEAEVSGRIYLHDFGYVDIETLAPFRVYETDLYPSSGGLVVTGKAIGGGYCKARLDVFDNTSYAVQIDADGDDIYEETIPGSW